MTSLKLKSSIVINAPFEMVLGYFLDDNTILQWMPIISEYKLISGEPNTVGSIYEFKFSLGGSIIPCKQEILEFNITSEGADLPSKLSFFESGRKEYTSKLIITFLKKEDSTEAIIEEEFDEDFKNNPHHALTLKLNENTYEFCLKNFKTILEINE
jgi:hypothetical protein